MNLEQKLLRLGGVADRSVLVRVSSRAEVDRALREGRIVRVGRGRYSRPHMSEALRRASGLRGVVSHLSAAQHWGWETVRPAEQPHVTVPRSRTPGAERRSGTVLHWADLAPVDVCSPG